MFDAWVVGPVRLISAQWRFCGSQVRMLVFYGHENTLTLWLLTNMLCCITHKQVNGEAIEAAQRTFGASYGPVTAADCEVALEKASAAWECGRAKDCARAAKGAQAWWDGDILHAPRHSAASAPRSTVMHVHSL